MLDTMQLESGLLWPIPMTLDVHATAEGLCAGNRLALQDSEGFTHTLLTVSDMWRPDQRREVEAVYGAVSDAHPGVRYLYEQVHDTYVGGAAESTPPGRPSIGAGVRGCLPPPRWSRPTLCYISSLEAARSCRFAPRALGLWAQQSVAAKKRIKQ